MKNKHYNNIVIQYTVYSLIFAIVFSIVLGVTFTKIITKNIIETHVKMYPKIIQNNLNQYNYRFEEIVNKNSEIENYLKRFALQNDIIYIKLWGKDSNVLWSNIDGIIGQIFENKEYEEALDGELAYEIKNESDRKENSFEIGNEKTFEFYMPIFQDSKVVGVLEVYKKNKDLLKNIDYSAGKTWLIVILIMFINYLLLLVYFYQLNRKYLKIANNLDSTQNVIILALAHQAELRDKETGFHLIRTVEYVKELALSAQKKDKYKKVITDKFVSDLTKSAPLHDIGKVGISDSILLKPGKLTDLEFEEVKKHCKLGAETLLIAKNKLEFETFLDMALEIVSYHHEKWDGTGYPYMIKREEIPLSARIMAIADVYDALVSERVYKKAYSHARAVEIIEESSGKHFDPQLVEIFLSVSDKLEKISIKFNDTNHTKNDF